MSNKLCPAFSSNVTNTSMSLSGRKSSLSTEPNSESSCTPHFLQNFSIFSPGTSICAFLIIQSPLFLGSQCPCHLLSFRLPFCCLRFQTEGILCPRKPL